MRIAITRAVSRALERCELTHLARCAIDIDLARTQHAVYEQALRDAGCDVRQRAEQPVPASSVFTEDTAVVLEEVAAMTRPGAGSPRGEIDSMAEALAPFRELRRIEALETLDGRDVLRLIARSMSGQRVDVALQGSRLPRRFATLTVAHNNSIKSNLRCKSA